MPMSRCRHCGKMIPNIYHRFHEKKQCKVMRGIDKREPQAPLPPKDSNQTQLEMYQYI